MFWQKKWGNFRKIGSKSLEKYGLEKPRGYKFEIGDYKYQKCIYKVKK